MRVGLPVGRLARYLAWMVAALVLADIAVQFSRYALHHGMLHGLVPMFDLDVEQNVPTWYQSMALLVVAALLTLTWKAAHERGDRMAWRWVVLAGAAAFLSVDESARIHESIGRVLQQRLEPGSGMVYAWVIPYGAFAIGLLLWYLPWIRALPSATRGAFVLAGCVYVGGALGMELIEASIEYAGHLTKLVQSITTGLEETLEMSGVVLLVRGIGRHLELEGTQVSLSTSSRPAAVHAVTAGASASPGLKQARVGGAVS